MLAAELETIESSTKIALNNSHACLAINGPMRLTLNCGTDITPPSPVRQALLTVIALAEGQSKSRTYLKDMFWGSVDPKRASANLRTAIYMLKRDLAALGPNAVVTSSSAVSLAKDKIVISPIQNANETFLEGMDLSLDDCEEFEDWLRGMRQAEPSVSIDQVSILHRREGKRTHFALGVVSTFFSGLVEDDEYIVENALSDVIRTIWSTTTVPVHDMRNCGNTPAMLPIESGQGPSHILQCLVDRRGTALMVRLKLLTAWSRRVLWISEPFDLCLEPEMMIAATEAMLSVLASDFPEDEAFHLFPWTALTALFSLDTAARQRTELQIAKMITSGAPEIMRCLGYFSQVFRENEGVGEHLQVSSLELCDLISALPSHDPMLPLWESLGGYCAHMLIGDNDLAISLLQSAHQRAPNFSLNLDHLAVVRLSQGDLEGASAAQRQCQKVGFNSPWRYTYEVTGAMIAMARGDHRESLAYANRALMRKPRFVGALRYAMAGLALSDKPDEARLMQTRIQQLRPGYDLKAWAENMIVRNPSGLGDTVANGFEKSGIF